MSAIPISFENTNLEILARIVKATAEKYDCSMSIDFHDGKRESRFIGDGNFKDHIFDEVRNFFK